MENDYVRGGVDKTLFIKSDQKDIMIAQRKVELFVEQMKKEFEMSMAGELAYFLGVYRSSNEVMEYLSRKVNMLETL